MNEFIVNECMVFVLSIKLGAYLNFAYDALRIIRRVIRHNEVFIAIEDLIFFVIAGMCVFAFLFESNNGILRLFIIAGILIGIYLFETVVGKYFVKYVAHFINIILKKIFKPIKMCIRKCKKGSPYEKQKGEEKQKI